MQYNNMVLSDTVWEYGIAEQGNRHECGASHTRCDGHQGSPYLSVAMPTRRPKSVTLIHFLYATGEMQLNPGSTRGQY